MLETIKKLVAIPSVTGAAPEPGKPYGPYVYEALETALAFCEGLGFRTKLDDEGYYGYAEIGAGEELMGILVHLDVVPPGSGWTHDPYGCEIAEGKLFGRGVVDDKGPAVAVIYAMKYILDSELMLDKRVRLILASQEEDGPWLRLHARRQLPGDLRRKGHPRSGAVDAGGARRLSRGPGRHGDKHGRRSGAGGAHGRHCAGNARQICPRQHARAWR